MTTTRGRTSSTARTTAGPYSLMRARRNMHRAARLAARNHIAAAIAHTEWAVATLRHEDARDPTIRCEYVASLLRLVDLHMTQTQLAAAIATIDEAVSALEASPVPDDTEDEAADRIADVLTRRGNAHRIFGSYELARTDLDRALSLAKSPLVAAGAHNAAGILAKDTGQLHEAAGHYDQALTEMCATLGEDHPDLASLHHNLAGLAHARGEHLEGEHHARHALALREQTNDPDSPEVASDLAVLGALLAGQGRNSEAEATFQHCLNLWTRHRGPEHYEVAVTLHHLARLHDAAGDRETAREELHRAWAIKDTALGSDHPETRVLRRDLERAERRL